MQRPERPQILDCNFRDSSPLPVLLASGIAMPLFSTITYIILHHRLRTGGDLTIQAQVP